MYKLRAYHDSTKTVVRIFWEVSWPDAIRDSLNQMDLMPSEDLPGQATISPARHLTAILIISWHSGETEFPINPRDL